MMKRSVALWLASACGAGLASGAEAQTAAPASSVAAQPSGAAQNGNPNDIVITAEKRPQLLIDVPQAVSVVSGRTLEAQHATNFQDYLKLIPGLQLDQNQAGNGRLIIRGVNTGSVASTVSVYVDETPFGSSSGLVNGGVLAGDFDTFDVDRIEVLRGPQGTLYGASSLSGVLRFVTAAPTTERVIVRGRAGIETVKDGDLGYSANLAVNVPISDTLAFRASGSFRKDGGFIDSIGTVGFLGAQSDVAKNINDDRVYGGRASLLFKPSDRASIRLTAIAQNIDADAPSLIEADPVTLKPLHGLSQSQFVPTFSDLHYRVLNATGIFNLGIGDLTTSTSFSKQNQTLRNDFTNPLSGALTLFYGLPPNEFIQNQNTNLKKFTQEVRLSGQSALLDWLVGAYYTNEKGLILQDLVAVEPGTLNPIDTVPILGTILGHVELPSKYREAAGFADATFHVTQQFDLQLGGRYSKNKQSARQVGVGFFGGGDPGVDFSTRSSEHVFTYSVAPKFKLSRNATIYARVAKGFRPGGPNVVPPDAPGDVPRTYRSDSVISYEAGVKAQSADHRFSVDAAAFHIKWKDIQLFTTVGVYGVNINGSGAKSDGVELTATARPVPALDLSLNAAYTNARLTGDTPTSVGGFKGDQLPFTPKLSFAFNGDYHWTLAPNARAHVGGSWRHLSGQTATYDADFVGEFGHQRHVRPYSVIDLNAGLNFGRYNIDGYVKNLGNSRGVTSTTPTTTNGLPLYPDGAIGTGIIRPRTFGLTLGFEY